MGSRERIIASKEVRMQHLAALEGAGINPYPAEPPLITHTNLEIHQRYQDLLGQSVSVVGRIKTIRDHGKAVFYDLQDPSSDKLQVYLRSQGEDDPSFKLISGNYDEGDFVNVRGEVFQTRTGEVTVKAEEMTMLAKAVLPPPTGVVIDPETARRQRYLELMTSRDARERFQKRSKMIQLMREEFMKRGFLEVETPVLDIVYGGASASPFTTRLSALDQEMYLRIANELYLKRLVCGNMGPVFEFSRNFRNEGMDWSHNPEFTAVELYEPYSDYNKMMEMSEKLFEKIAIDLHGTTEVQFGEHIIDFKAPWRRLTIYDGLREAYGIEPETVSNEELQKLAVKASLAGRYSRRGDILLALFENYYEGKLIQPTFVLDYPKETSPLTKVHRANPNLAERFETNIGGLEVMNCYTELNDPRDQRERFELERQKQLEGDRNAMPYDEDFIVAMEHGFPPMGGIGISIDRMAMLLTNTHQIRDIILFPPVKSR